MMKFPFLLNRACLSGLCVSTSALVAAGLPATAWAQSTADTRTASDVKSSTGALSSINPDAGDVVVTGRGAAGGGAITPVTLPRAESVITDAFIKTQSAGSNPFQLLSLAPGVNVSSSGSTGVEGGTSISIRGFQSNQLGVSLDGVPVNDSGNYATYAHEYVDTENLSRIFVLPGAGDAETPNISATGGVIGMVVRKPSQDFHISAAQTVGSFDFLRSYVRVDTGTMGNSGTRAFIAYSHSSVDLWRGQGAVTRDHVDAMVEHETPTGHVFSAAVYFNHANSNGYQGVSKAQLAQYGYHVNFPAVFVPEPAPVAGTAQNSDNSALVGPQFQRAMYYKLFYNPFDNMVLSTRASLRLGDKVHLDIQPYLWYGHGSGGGPLYLSERDTALLGAPRDLNGDGDTLDTVLRYGAWSQNQYRPGVISRLKVTTGRQEIIVGLHYEHSNLHEYRQILPVRIDGRPDTYWGGENYELRRADGSFARPWDQKTITTTIRPFIQDVVTLLDDRLILSAGMQLPIVARDGTNLLPAVLRTSNGVVAPENVHVRQSKLIGNGGATFKVAPDHTLFASFAQTFRANDNSVLYAPGTDFSNLKPESALDLEIGYRYNGPLLIASLTGYHIDYSNRQQTLYDVVLNNTLVKNVGDVRLQGIEAEIGTVPIHHMSFYVSAALNDSALKKDLMVGVTGNTANTALPTKGRHLTDIPKATLGGQFRYDDGVFMMMAQAKYTGRRYSTLTNDDSVDPYTLINMAAGYTLPADITGKTKVQLTVNVDNLTNKGYLAGLNFTNNLNTTNGVPGSAPTFSLGAPRSFSVRLRADF